MALGFISSASVLVPLLPGCCVVPDFFIYVCFKDLPSSHPLLVFPVAKSSFANVVQFLVLLFTDNSNVLILISPSFGIPRQSVRSGCG